MKGTQRCLRTVLVGFTLLLAAGPANAQCPDNGGDDTITSVPALSGGEIRCVRHYLRGTQQYLAKSFRARQNCYVLQSEGAFLAGGVDCNASVTSGTRHRATDRRIARAEAVMTRRILTHCTNVTLENMGFPGFCPDLDGAPFEAFDLNRCQQERARDWVQQLLDIEHPAEPGEALTVGQDRFCADFVARHSSRMVQAEFRERSTCLLKQVKHAESPLVDCRSDADPQAPGTGRKRTDTHIIGAHNLVLRGIPNHCTIRDMSTLGFPHRCEFPPTEEGGVVYPLAALTECMYETHHAEMFRFLDSYFPCSSKCGNGKIDFTEFCDDGNTEYMYGDFCRGNCTLTNCGDPNDDGSVNATDSLYILRTSVGVESCSLLVCDVTGDLSISAVDALMHLQHVVGQDVALSCPIAGLGPDGTGVLSLTCGNGAIEEPEQCDDGDNSFTFGDPCNAACRTVDCGDPNDNGVINILDAQYILNATVGNTSCTDPTCDTTGNRTVNSTDALRVLMHSVGLPVALNCPAGSS